MKQFPSEKYNIAWFKLAECVTRGEKERALGVYKLLSHSIDDSAFALQLEGDLLLAFEDEGAAEKYAQAAQMYKNKQRFVESAAVYEHLFLLQPQVEDHAAHLISLYHVLSFTDKMDEHLEGALDRFSNHTDPTKLNAFLTKLQEMSPECYDLAQKMIAG